MGNPLKFALIVLFAVTTTAAQTPAGQTALGPNQLQTQIRRLPNGKRSGPRKRNRRTTRTA